MGLERAELSSGRRVYLLITVVIILWIGLCKIMIKGRNTVIGNKSIHFLTYNEKEKDESIELKRDVKQNIFIIARTINNEICRTLKWKKCPQIIT